MKPVRIRTLQNADAEALLTFELDNRERFERHIAALPEPRIQADSQKAINRARPKNQEPFKPVVLINDQGAPLMTLPFEPNQQTTLRAFFSLHARGEFSR
jgi:hypothetical protein